MGDTPTPSGMVEGVYKKIKGIFSNNKELVKFADKSVTVKKLNSKAQKTFKIGDDLKIEPIISLYGKIEIKKGIPNFTELKKYMHEMLESVKKGTLLGNGDIQDE